jgi:hypothetical protein
MTTRKKWKWEMQDANPCVFECAYLHLAKFLSGRLHDPDKPRAFSPRLEGVGDTGHFKRAFLDDS